jgi:hypothetical protein
MIFSFPKSGFAAVVKPCFTLLASNVFNSTKADTLATKSFDFAVPASPLIILRFPPNLLKYAFFLFSFVENPALSTNHCAASLFSSSDLLSS